MHDPSVLIASIKNPIPGVRLKFDGGLMFSRSALIDIWHDEPHGEDAGTVCGRSPRSWSLLVWGLNHRHHLRIKLIPKQKFNRWMWQRCAKCGGRSRRNNPVNTSLQWDGAKQEWGKSAPGLYHDACASVHILKGQLEEAQEALRIGEITALDLERAGMDSTVAWRVLYFAGKDSK